MIEYWTRLKAAMEAKSAREKIPFGVTELADSMGVSYQAVAKVKNGGSFGKDNNIKAAKILCVNSDWLATGEGAMLPIRGESSGGPAAASEIAHTNNTSDESQKDFLIPQYAAGGGMGNGLILEEKQPGVIKSWSVDHEWLRLNVRHHTGVNNLCIVTGFGPSMQPKYNPGDPLLLDRGVTTVETEGIYFFRVGKHGYIKQLQRIPTEDGLIVRAKSLNPTYDPFDISVKMDFEVFGKVLSVWRSEQV